MLNEKQFPTMKPENSEKKEEARKIDLSKIKIEPLFEEFVDFDTFSKSDMRVVKVKNSDLDQLMQKSVQTRKNRIISTIEWAIVIGVTHF